MFGRKPDADRSPDERARAAAERAARRAERLGMPQQAPPPETFGAAVAVEERPVDPTGELEEHIDLTDHEPEPEPQGPAAHAPEATQAYDVAGHTAAEAADPRPEDGESEATTLPRPEDAPVAPLGAPHPSPGDGELSSAPPLGAAEAEPEAATPVPEAATPAAEAAELPSEPTAASADWGVDGWHEAEPEAVEPPIRGLPAGAPPADDVPADAAAGSPAPPSGAGPAPSPSVVEDPAVSSGGADDMAAAPVVDEDPPGSSARAEVLPRSSAVAEDVPAPPTVAEQPGGSHDPVPSAHEAGSPSTEPIGEPLRGPVSAAEPFEDAQRPEVVHVDPATGRPLPPALDETELPPMPPPYVEPDPELRESERPQIASRRHRRWRPDRRAGSPTLAPARSRRHGGRGYARLRALTLLVIVLMAAAVWFVLTVLQPLHGDGRGAVSVRVPENSDVATIGTVLERRGVVASARWFQVNATVTGRRSGLRPGSYTLPRDMSYGAALDALTKGPSVKAVRTFKLTVPEGRTRKDIEGLVADTSLEGSYARASGSDAALKRARGLGLPRAGTTTEGFLFPATYDLPEAGTATGLVDRQLDAFEQNIDGVSMARAKRAGLSRYEVLIIASMIEREAQVAGERSKIAAVIYNRLKAGMPLGIDATIRYAEDNWTRPLRQSELDRRGPYNTRLNQGLPPTPIGNPGLASIRAAAAPADVSFLYYVARPDGSGRHAFSSTFERFGRDAAAYEAARKANGGNAPG